MSRTTKPSCARGILPGALLFAAVTAAADTPAAVYPDYNTNPVAPDKTGMESTAKQVAKRIRLGWNIGNTLEASGGETAWGNPKVSGELIELVKRNGFDAIRIPVSWDQHADPETAKIDEAWMARVKEVVRLCTENKLYTILNVHWDGGWLENNVTPEKQQAVNAKQKAFWQQIATQMRDFDEYLLFAGANEPDAKDAAGMKVLLSYHQTFVDAVRATGGRNAYRILVVQGPKTDIRTTAEMMRRLPEDTVKDRMMVEVHFYTPYRFALMNKDADWGKQAFYWGKDNRSGSDAERNADRNSENEIKDLFELMEDNFVDEGIPVVLGEYCAMRRTGQLSGRELELHLQSRDDWHEFVTKEALAHGLIPFYWDTGGLDNFSGGIFDRDNNRVFDKRTLEALKKGAGK